MSGKGLVVVTGANGYIAGRTVEAFLKAGYRVRGTVRSLKSAKLLQSALAQYADRLEMVEVPDMTSPGAFDDAVKGAVAIAHLASPVSMRFDDPEPVIRAALNGTVRVLESAEKEPSIKHFVLLSSIVAMLTNAEGPVTVTEADWNNFAEEMVALKGKDAPGPVIYSASKAAGEKAFWKFKEDRKPAFTMTAINPCYVVGPPMATLTSADQVNETILSIWEVFKGHALETAGVSRTGGYVDVRDVARMVVFSVEHSSVTDGQRYITAAGFANNQAVADILRKAYPDRRDIIQEGKPGDGYSPDFSFTKERVYDASKSIKATGQTYIRFDQSVLDTAKALEHLL